MMWLIIGVIVSVYFGGVCSLPSPSEANVRLYLTKKGIDYANDVTMSNIVHEVEGLKIPSVSITQTIFWNRISLALFNSKVNKAKLESSSLSFEYGHLKLSLHLTSAELGGKYSYRGGFLGHGTGTYSAKLKRVSIYKYLLLDKNAQGKPYLASKSCVTSIGDISSQFKGGSSFIINFLVQLVKRSVQDNVEDLICKSITESINERGRRLPKMYQDRFDVPLIPTAKIHFPILEEPSIERGYVDFLIEGGIRSNISTLNSSSSGQGASQVRYSPNPSKMLSIVLSDRLFNSLTELYYKAGVIQTEALEADDFSPPLAVKSDLSRPPIINTNVSGSFLTLYLNGTVRKNLSIYEVDLLVKGEFEIEEENRIISGKVKNLRFEVTRYGQNIPKDLRNIIEPALYTNKQNIAETLRRSFMNKMAPLPLIPTVKLVNKRVVYRQDYIVFESDVEELK